MSYPTVPVRSPRRAAALVLALGVGLLSGCSSDDEGNAGAAPSTSAEAAPSSSVEASSSAPAAPASSSPAEAESETVTVTAGEMFFELSEDSFSPGEYTIEVVNEGDATHDLVVERDGEDVAATESIAPGGSATLTVTLEEGDYVFYCSIGNHRAMGMEEAVSVAS